MANKTEIAQIVAVIGAAYPNFSPSEQTLDVYYLTLNDLDFEELKTAVMHSIAEAGRKFAPSVGEIRGAVGELRSRAANVPTSYQAWEEVLRQIRINGGDFGKPVWSHPIVERAMKSLGWRELRMSENQTHDRARFIMAYEQLQARAENDGILLPQVRSYIEDKGGRFLDDPVYKMGKLADGMRK